MTALSRYIFKNINPYVSKLPTDYVYENAPLVEHAYSSIAQSVEHSAVNRSVVGSSPTWGVRRKTKLNIWLLGQAVKTSPFHGGNTGSIPVGVIRRHSQVVRHGSATPLSSVQIRLSPLNSLRFLREFFFTIFYIDRKHAILI